MHNVDLLNQMCIEHPWAACNSCALCMNIFVTKNLTIVVLEVWGRYHYFDFLSAWRSWHLKQSLTKVGHGGCCLCWVRFILSICWWAGDVGRKKDAGMTGMFGHITISSVVKMWGWVRRLYAFASEKGGNERRKKALRLKSWGRGGTHQARFSLVQPITHHWSQPMEARLSAMKAHLDF